MGNNNRKKRSGGLRVRRAVQLFFFGLIALIAVNHSLVEAGKGLAVVFGPVFCGWVCPMGSIPEWVGKLGRRLFKRRYNHFIPEQIDKPLRYLRYVMLAWVIYMTAATGKLVFSDIDPYFALFNFWTSEVAVGGLLVLGATLLASLWVERPWCKYACPYGAVLGLTNLIRPLSIRRVDSSCKSCAICSRECPMNISVQALDVVRDHQCISCMECTSEAICPIENVVVMGTAGTATAPAAVGVMGD